MNIKKGITALGYTLHYLFQPRLNRYKLEQVLQTDDYKQDDALKNFFKTEENDIWFKEFVRDALDNNKEEYYKGILIVLNLYTQRMEKLLLDTLTILDLTKLIKINEYSTPFLVQYYANVLLKKEHCVFPESEHISPLCEKLYQRLGPKSLSTFELFLKKEPSLIKDIMIILLEKQAWHNFISKNEINFLSHYVDFNVLSQNTSFIKRMDDFFIQFKDPTLPKLHTIYELLDGIYSTKTQEWIMGQYDIPEHFHTMKRNMAYTYHSERRANQPDYKKKYEQLSLYEVTLGFSKYKDKNKMMLNLEKDFMEDIIAQDIHTREVVNPFKKIPKDEFIFKI